MIKDNPISILTLETGAKLRTDQCVIGFDTNRLQEHRLLALHPETQDIIAPIKQINGKDVTVEQFDAYVSQWAQALLESPEHRADVARILKYLNYVATPIKKIEKVGRVPKAAKQKRRSRNKVAKKARQRQRKYK